MNMYDFMEDCQYDFDDIKARIRTKLIKRDDNINIMRIAPFIDAVDDNLLIVFYVDLGQINQVNLGFYINNEHLRLWHISKKDIIDKLLCKGNVDL